MTVVTKITPGTCLSVERVEAVHFPIIPLIGYCGAHGVDPSSFSRVTGSRYGEIFSVLTISVLVLAWQSRTKSRRGTLLCVFKITQQCVVLRNVGDGSIPLYSSCGMIGAV